jgi:hypothetical protein
MVTKQQKSSGHRSLLLQQEILIWIEKAKVRKCYRYLWKRYILQQWEKLRDFVPHNNLCALPYIFIAWCLVTYRICLHGMVMSLLIYVIFILYEVWQWNSQNYFIASIPIYLITERGHLQSTLLEQICTWLSCCGVAFSDVVTFFFLDVFSFLKSLPLKGRLYLWKQPEVIWNQIKEIGWVFHFTNWFLGQKLFNKECLVS